MEFAYAVCYLLFRCMILMLCSEVAFLFGAFAFSDAILMSGFELQPEELALAKYSLGALY